MRLRGAFALTVTAVAASLVVAVPAAFATGPHTALLPNGCTITGENGVNGTIMVWADTAEVSNCASLQTKMRWYDANNSIWVTSTAGYSALSYVGISKYTPVQPCDWSDHNGKNTTDGAAWGFRLDG